MRRATLAAGAAVMMMTVGAARPEPIRDHQAAMMAERLFPTLSALHGPRVRAALAPMLQARADRMDACGEVVRCRIEAALWTDDERTRLVDMVHQETRPPATVSDDGVSAQLSREVLGLNNILRVYGLGGAPKYPQIDGPDDPHGQRAAQALALSRASADDPATALDPSLGLSLALLDANNRVDAVAFEPIDGGLNAAAFGRARTIDWPRYHFTALIVLGAGPDDLVTPLSVRSKIRIRAAAQRYADGDAPFLIVSGGAVHPKGTTHVEALEMRRALIERYDIPADAILIEPYARHTTTNLRNAARLLVQLRVPKGREALIVSDPEHIASIASADFVSRNQQELGYQPGIIGPRLSNDALPFRPSAASSRIDPADPLDP